MTYELRAIITDEWPGIDTVIARTWLAKGENEKVEERAFLLPAGVKLTDKAPWNLIAIAADQTWEKINKEKKPAPKKRPAKNKEGD